MNVLRSALIVVVACAVCAVAAAPAAAATCKNAGVLPEHAADVRAARAAVLCLVNRERTKRHLVALTQNGTLQKIATSLSKDMVAHQYFDHTSPSGRTFDARLRAAHWHGRSAGENIAWGNGDRGTPAGIVNAWMHSPGHRANILRKTFRRGGVGIAIGAPQAGVDNAAVYSMDYDTP